MKISMKTSGQGFQSYLEMCAELKCELSAFSFLTRFIHPGKCFPHSRTYVSAFVNAKPRAPTVREDRRVRG